MSVPFPTLALQVIAADNTTVDVTTLTSKGGVWDELQGYNGADWGIAMDEDKVCAKKQNYQTLAPTVFYDSGSAPTRGHSFGGVLATWLAVDEMNADSTGRPYGDSYGLTASSLALAFAAGQINCGVSYDVPATAELRTLVWIGELYGGTYRATATLSDGSASAAPITLTTEARSSFKVTYRVPPTSTGATLHLEIRKTAGAGTGNMNPHIVYTTVPIPRVMPRDYANFLQRKRILGGSIA